MEHSSLFPWTTPLVCDRLAKERQVEPMDFWDFVNHDGLKKMAALGKFPFPSQSAGVFYPASAFIGWRQEQEG